MAWIRLEKQVGMYAGKNQYDGVCEENDDLNADATNGYTDFNGSHIEQGVGSMAFCLEDSKLYAKGSDGTWAEVGA